MKKLLSESAFDPRVEDGPNSIIVDTATLRPEYAEDRAKELISEAQNIFSAKVGGPDEAKSNREHYHRKMTQAIGLLVLARAFKQ